MREFVRVKVVFLALSILLTACQSDSVKEALSTDANQVALRAIQSRAFDTTDKNKTLRTVIATLQGLDFITDKADSTLGTVSATKLKGYNLRMTISRLRKKGMVGNIFPRKHAL